MWIIHLYNYKEERKENWTPVKSYVELKSAQLLAAVVESAGIGGATGVEGVSRNETLGAVVTSGTGLTEFGISPSENFSA